MDASMVQSLINSEDSVNNAEIELEDEIQDRLRQKKEASALDNGIIEDEEEEELRTYKKAHSLYSGEIVELKDDYSKVIFSPTEEMSVDDYDLVNQGFVFSAAHLAAISAVNNPKAIITNCTAKFLAPLEIGTIIEFEAFAKRGDMKKSEVKVIGKLLGVKIFEADFHAVKLDKHPLKIKLVQETRANR